MLEQIILRHAPRLPRRLNLCGLKSIISLDKKTEDEFVQSVSRKVVLLPVTSKTRKCLRYIDRRLSAKRH